MRIGTQATLFVKFASGHYSFRVNPYRNWQAIIRYFTNRPGFRFAILYEYDRQARKRGRQIGYFDKYRDEFNRP